MKFSTNHALRLSAQQQKWLFGLLFMLGVSITQHAGAQKMGANYNENINLIDPALIKQSGTKWVRAFVPILKLVDIENRKITGVNNTKVNGVKIGPMINTSKPANGSANLILSFKFDFKGPLGRVPEANSAEADKLIQACKRLINRNAGGIVFGSRLAILAVGNEPLFETPTGAENLRKYKAFTKRLINEFTTLRNDNNSFTYKIYVGAVNKMTENANNAINLATIELAQNNNKVTGLDFHPHVSKLSQIESDLRILRNDKNYTKKIMVTEFSMQRFIKTKWKTNLGNWGAQNGYGRDLKIWQYINAVIQKAENGNPISPNEFRSFWNSRSWYPRNWFDRFYNAFKQYDVEVATYGMVRERPDGDRVTANSPTWIVNAAFNEQLLGNGPGGMPVANPFSHPGWKKYVDNPASRASSASSSEEPENLNTSKNIKEKNIPSLSLYPNPAKDTFKIRLAGMEGASFRIFDMNGRAVINYENLNENQEFTVSELDTGIYIIKVVNSDISLTEKIVVR